MSCSLVFIERIEEIDFLDSFISTDTIVISLVPSVSAELSKRGISCKTTLEFFGIEGHRYVLEKSFEIIENLRPFLKSLETEHIQHAFENTWIFYFRFRLHYLLSMLYIIDKVVKYYKPNTIIVIPAISESKSETDKKNYLLHEVVEQYGLTHKILIQYAKKRKSLNNQNKNLISIKNLIKRSIFYVQLSIFNLMRKNKNTILALEDTYNMPRFIREVSQSIDHSFPVYLFIKKSSLKTRLKEMIKGESFSFIFLPSDSKFNESDSFQELIMICGTKIINYFNDSSKLTTIFDVNISPFLISYIENIMNQKMLVLYGELLSLRKILEVVKPNKVFSQHSLGIGYVLGEICLDSNISALLISHGSHVPQSNALAKLEWSLHSHTIINSHYPFVAVQSPYAEKFLNSQNNLISKPIRTGPLLFGRRQKTNVSRSELRKKIFGKFLNKRIILHAGTPKSWDSFRPLVYQTIDEYVQNINDVIEAVEEITGIYLAIRFRPQKGLSLEDLRALLKKSDCYGIYIDRSFENYLMASDYLLSYSSTSIEEALQFKLPVIQYDPDGKYEHIRAEVLKYNGINNISSIYSVLTQKDLRSALEWLNENHHNSDNINLSWSEYAFKDNDQMEWLNKMDLTRS
jgi:hypothetical protein